MLTLTHSSDHHAGHEATFDRLVFGPALNQFHFDISDNAQAHDETLLVLWIT